MICSCGRTDQSSPHDIEDELDYTNETRIYGHQHSVEYERSISIVQPVHEKDDHNGDAQTPPPGPVAGPVVKRL